MPAAVTGRAHWFNFPTNRRARTRGCARGDPNHFCTHLLHFLLNPSEAVATGGNKCLYLGIGRPKRSRYQKASSQSLIRRRIGCDDIEEIAAAVHWREFHCAGATWQRAVKLEHSRLGAFPRERVVASACGHLASCGRDHRDVSQNTVQARCQHDAAGTQHGAVHEGLYRDLGATYIDTTVGATPARTAAA